jgi:putative addiction module component (TIGR02574 family)
MDEEFADLLKDALSLSPSEREALANPLLDSLEGIGDSVEDSWEQEVARRMEDLKAGKAITIPWEEVKKKGRGLLESE